MGLFREEAAAKAEGEWLGRANVVVAPKQRLFAIVALVFVIGILALAFRGTYERRSHYLGLITPSYPPVAVSASALGTVTGFAVRSGELVHRGQVLGYFAPDGDSEIDHLPVALRSPIDGVVFTISAAPGEHVGASQPLIAIATLGTKLVARFAIPGKDLPYLTPGANVVLRYDAFPSGNDRTYTGRVQRLEPSTRGDIGAYPYELTVTLDQNQIKVDHRLIPLNAGLRVEADIPLERRSFFDWFFLRQDT
jgi:multidrug efflux pump subunit AcrA (membrane-fusion protein)